MTEKLTREDVVQELIERLEKAQAWMREPDHAERFSLDDLMRWANERPTGVLPVATNTLTRQRAEIASLRGRLEREEEDCRRYDKHLYACNEQREAAEARVAELTAALEALLGPATSR